MLSLVFSYPDYLSKKRRIKGFVQHLTYYRRYLILWIYKAEKLDGKSLVSLMNKEVDELHAAIYAEEAYCQRRRAIRTPSYKYIRLLSTKEVFCARTYLALINPKPSETVKVTPGSTKHSETSQSIRVSITARQIIFQEIMCQY